MSILTIEPGTTAPVIRLRGELDWASSGTLDAALLDRLDTHGAVVVDLRGLSFTDCAGLGILLAVNWRAERSGRRMVLARPSPAMTRLLRLTGCDALLETRSSLNEAVRSLDGG